MKKTLLTLFTVLSIIPASVAGPIVSGGRPFLMDCDNDRYSIRVTWFGNDTTLVYKAANGEEIDVECKSVMKLDPRVGATQIASCKTDETPKIDVYKNQTNEFSAWVYEKRGSITLPRIIACKQH